MTEEGGASASAPQKRVSSVAVSWQCKGAHAAILIWCCELRGHVATDQLTADDPIAYLGPPGKGTELPDAVRTNEKLILALTKEGGHLGWCDHRDPWGPPKWVEAATLNFLETVFSQVAA